ncbi:unnamed protein product [Cuscuta campestris]|uniref:Protein DETOXIFICATION n=1 Tax=Cuscuta campestris TaxID=132261 RepID=A0A484N5A7_9ASTE|nr:unnamed protein product [Cuscuta campestris]
MSTNKDKDNNNGELNERLLSESKQATAAAAGGGEIISSELEEALSDRSFSKLGRLRRAAGVELGNLFRLAAPAIVVYLLNNVTSMSTQIFCGHLGNLQLAAVSLGNSGIQLLAYGVMV